MITFAQPLGLLALLALPLIVALHMLRPQRRRLLVSSTALWREALRVREIGSGLRWLPRDLGLWLALGIALALALAVAQPGWETRTAGSGDTVVIVDASASMQADGRLQRARRAAARFVAGLPDTAQVMLVASASRPRLLAGFDASRASFGQQLAALQASDEAGAPARAVEFALTLLRTREAGRVVFFTDGAFEPFNTAANVEFTQAGEPLGNLAVTRFDVRPLLDQAGRYEALVSVHNFSDEAASVPLRIEAARATVAEQRLDVAANGVRTLVVPLRGDLGGPASARIASDDGLERDNSAYAVIPTDEPLRVAFVGAPNADLASALAAVPAVSVENRPSPDAQSLERIARRFDVVLVNGVDLPALPAGNFLLIDSVPGGFVFAGVSESADRVSSSADSVSSRVARPVISGRGSSALLRDIDFRGVSIESARRIEIDAQAAGVAPLLWSPDSVLALAAVEDGRKVVYLGFDVSRSTLPTTAALPLFIDHALQWLRPREREHAATQIVAGKPWPLGTHPASAEIIVRSPNGDAEFLDPQADLLFESTSSSGIYSFSVDGLASYLAVNIGDARESDLRPARHAKASPGTAMPDSQASSVTAPLWPWLALIALVIAAVDWALRARGYLNA